MTYMYKINVMKAVLNTIIQSYNACTMVLFYIDSTVKSVSTKKKTV